MKSRVSTYAGNARSVCTHIAAFILAVSFFTIGLETAALATSTFSVSEAATFPVNSETLGGATLTVSPQKVGDIVIFNSEIHSHTITVTGVTCPETGAWHFATRYIDTVNGVITEEMWWAVVTSTSTSPTHITATYSASIASLSPELVSDSFTTSSPATWSFVAGNGRAAASTTSIVFPSVTSVTSNASANQLYWGYAQSTQTAVSGSTPGFTYASTAEGNLTTSNVALSANTTYAPTASETPVSNNTSIGAIFAATPA